MPPPSTTLLATANALAVWTAFGAFGASGAHAADLAAMKSAFGNTVMATYGDGRSQRLWLHEDGSYDAMGRRGRPSSGQWSLKGGKVCLRQAKPFAYPFGYCSAFPADPHIGAVWTGRDMGGAPIRLTVVKGMGKPGS
ncbi:MAG: hypothetical protein ABI655_06535 [Phenylobacterium sp.]